VSAYEVITGRVPGTGAAASGTVTGPDGQVYGNTSGIPDAAPQAQAAADGGITVDIDTGVEAAPAEPVEKAVSLNLNAVNALTIEAGTYLTSTVTLKGQYAFTWDNADVTVKVNGEAITNGYKAKYASEAVAIVIESNDNTVEETLNLQITIVPEADEIDINLEVANNLTIGAGTYLESTVTLDGEYTFTWTNSENANVTIKIDGVEITSGHKATYEAKTVTIVIESSDNTVDVNVSLVITKTPEIVVPDEEWTKNY
jgi:hypothetical protein